MDWVPALTLMAIFAGLTVAVVRTVRKGRRRWMLFLIPVIVAILAVRWASYRDAWAELAAAAAGAGLISLVWWFSYGRRLPPPTDDNIRVWTKDDPF